MRESQYLNYGCSYGGREEDFRTELTLIERTEDEELDKNEAEALYVASEIRKLLESVPVTEIRDGEATERKAVYSDIAILLRSPSGSEEVFRDILTDKGIPAVTEGRSGYFKTKEVRHVLNILNSLDNPRQDIPFEGLPADLDYCPQLLAAHKILLYTERVGLKDTGNKLIHIGKPIEFDREDFEEKLKELDRVSEEEPERVKELVSRVVTTYSYVNQ